jgi:hypothetical protein
LRHSDSKEIEVLKKTCVSAGLVAGVAGAVLLGSGSAAQAGCGGCGGGCEGSHHSSWNENRNHSKNHNRINIRIRVRNNNFNNNPQERERERERPIIIKTEKEKHHWWDEMGTNGQSLAGLPVAGTAAPAAGAPLG